ncbi:hypothetical protein OHA40_19970 [Nocardia sp. NBC_00508]|uniref:hypothetical protein n=1 Tax=Nocardia sp. NBC_00508 TaxID=2975992 RepID=UPI002E801E44|nr:hypothetical protein [Nocardia sp. NBC_00508]WUD64007.1 hypothetical protein OHA40_19970 [Nocardia sp. NBC_00508]
MDRIPTGRAAAAVAVALACLAATGCGDSKDTGTQPNTSTTRTAAPSTPTEDPGGNQGNVFTADPTIVGAHPIPFQSWTRLADNKIAVNFQTGTPECYGVDAAVAESDSTVTVELRSGTRTEAVGRMCTMIAVFGTLEVPLKAPLGNRTVLSAV